MKGLALIPEIYTEWYLKDLQDTGYSWRAPVKTQWGWCTKPQSPWIRLKTHCNGQSPVKLVGQMLILYDALKSSVPSGWMKRQFRGKGEGEAEILLFLVCFFVLFWFIVFALLFAFICSLAYCVLFSLVGGVKQGWGLNMGGLGDE